MDHGFRLRSSHGISQKRIASNYLPKPIPIFSEKLGIDTKNLVIDLYPKSRPRDAANGAAKKSVRHVSISIAGFSY
jgi:hypothetical protein